MRTRQRVTVVGLVLAAAVLTGCGGASTAAGGPADTGAPAATTAAPAATTAAPPATGVAPPATGEPGGDRHGGGSGGRHGGRGEAAAPALPADWPALPLPPGVLEGSTGSAPGWTVQLRAAGSAADVRRSAEAFYRARGFRDTDTADVLVRGPLRLVVVTENRDHSATSTVLVLGLSRGVPAAS